MSRQAPKSKTRQTPQPRPQHGAPIPQQPASIVATVSTPAPTSATSATSATTDEQNATAFAATTEDQAVLEADSMAVVEPDPVTMPDPTPAPTRAATEAKEIVDDVDDVDAGVDMDVDDARTTALEDALEETPTAPETIPPETIPEEETGDEPGTDWSYLGGDVALETDYPLVEQPAVPWRQRAVLWLRARTGEQWVWFAVLALATLLRFWGLGDKPLHHDESMHAFYSLLFAYDPGSYSYNPLLHGPFQFHAVGIMDAIILALQHLFHVGSGAVNPWINDATTRIVPASFGVGIVALPIWLRRELGRAGALIAAFLLAVSPAFVYFSRFLREDIYFNFFMFAIVVCAVRFATSRSGRWLVGMCLASVLAYATFEGIYLTAAIFVVFLVGLLLWEAAYSLAPRLPAALTLRERLFFSRALLLCGVGAVGGAIGLVVLHQVSTLSKYINASQANANKSAAAVQNLENISVLALLYFSIGLALLVIAVLQWQLTHEPAADTVEWLEHPERMSALERIFTCPARLSRRVSARLDVREQRLLRVVLGISWSQWFVAYVLSFLLFAALYWIIPDGTNGITLFSGFSKGVGSGMWQGLYYWIEQQQVARGGQPWYYYLLLLPLYEQLAIVFGIGGIIYTLRHPTRFRVFLVWWFVASLFLYSWAGEKMPWLSIHMLLPLMLLAGVTLNWVAERVWEGFTTLRAQGWTAVRSQSAVWRALPRRVYAGAGLALLAVLLLVPMVHSMWMLSRPDAADGPLEMMVYVQTTTDVDLVMNKINRADQVMYGGQHKLKIAVGQGEEWPFYWYLRDYYFYSLAPTATFDPQIANMSQYDVLILLPSDAQAFLAQHPKGWHAKEYKLRSWFDESYKPVPDGNGLWAYLTYGSTLPKGVTPATAKFNPATAASRLWSWLWVRQPLGATNGSYDFTLVVRDGVQMQP